MTQFDLSGPKTRGPCFLRETGPLRAIQIKIELISDAAPDLRRIDILVRIELLCLLQKDVRCLRIDRIGNATVVDRADGSALWFIEMANALGAAIMCNHVDVITNSLTVAHMVALRFRIATGFENRLIGTFG